MTKQAHIVPFPSKTSGDKSARAKRADTALIRECVIFAQSVAAWHAGFDADPDGDNVHAESLGDHHDDRAKQALKKITRMSARTPEEVQAKAKIVPFVNLRLAGCVWDELEQAFVVSFGADVKTFLEPIVNERLSAEKKANYLAEQGKVQS
jgi:hypothetical protein